MKKVLTTLGSGTAGQTYPEESFKHIQDANQDTSNASILWKIEDAYGSYTTNDVIIVRGLKVTSGSPTAPGACVITAGTIYYNGELYESSGFNATITGSNVVLFTLPATYLGIDPTPFTDGTLKNVHSMGTCLLTQGGTGTGIKDFSVGKPIVRTRDHQVTQVATILITNAAYGSAFTTLLTGATPITLTTPNDGIARRYRVTAKLTLDNGVSASNSDYAQLRIYNTTDSVEYDHTASGKAATNSASFFDTPVMTRTVDILPNKTIAFQCYAFCGANMNGQYLVFELTEL